MADLARQLLLVADQACVTVSSRAIVEAVPLSPDQPELVLAESRELCAQIASLPRTLPTPEDKPESYRSLAALWLELRFQWQRHNLVANYDTVVKGERSPLVPVRASAASFMLQRIERLLPEAHRDRLRDAAVEVLDRLRDEVSSSPGAA
jgi:hypothetical protein